MARVKMAAVVGWSLLSLSLLSLAACNRNEDKTPAETGEAPAATEAPAAPVPAAQAPKRKPGFWEQRVSVEGMVQTTRICIDEALEERLGWWGQQATQEACEKNLVTPQAGGGWRFSSVCDMGTGGKMTASGVATGDFDSRYVIEAESSTVGAEAPQMNGTRQMRIEAVWQGACPQGFKPGDIELPGGMRLNLLDMSGAAGQ